MSKFNEFVFLNQNSVDVELTLEAPVGTIIIGPVMILANGTYTNDPGVADVSEVKLTVVAARHEDYPDTEVFTLTGSPYDGYFQKLSAQTSIGSIHGTANVTF